MDAYLKPIGRKKKQKPFSKMFNFFYYHERSKSLFTLNSNFAHKTTHYGSNNKRSSLLLEI